MGCKESKHKVAEGNTIITPSPSKRLSNIDIVGSSSNNNNNKDVQKIPENPTNSAKSPGQKQESLKANGDSNARNCDEGTPNVNIAKEKKNAKGDSRVDEKVKESEIVEVFDDNCKEIKKENVGESNKKKEGEGVVEEKEREKGNLVCEESPNNFFSSRKDDETIEGIISEGISGTSVYYTPHKDGASEDQSKKLESAEEMKESVEETKDEIKTEEAAANVTEVTWVEKVEAAGLDEGNPVKESKVTTLAEGNSVEKIKAADVVVEINLVKEVEVEAIEEDLVKEIKTADRNEEILVKEEKVVHVAAEKPVKEVEIAGVTQGNPVIKEDKVKEAEAIDTSKANIPVLKQEAEPIVESKGAANKEDKISSANEENVTETSEEDSKTN